MQLTAKEQAALNFLARNNGAGAKTKAGLKDDNCSWFMITDLMEGLGLNRNEAAGIMSALSAKGLCVDYEAGAKVRYDRATWYVTEEGIDASDLGEVPAVSPKIAPYAVLVTLKTGEKVRVLAVSLEAAEAEAKANHGAQSAIVERNVDGKFSPV